MMLFLIDYQVELSQAELEQLIGKTKGELAALDEEDEEANEDAAADGDDKGEEDDEMDEADEKKVAEEKTMNEDEKLDAEYGLDEYDNGTFTMPCRCFNDKFLVVARSSVIHFFFYR